MSTLNKGLDKLGENMSDVKKYLYREGQEVFDKITEVESKLKCRSFKDAMTLMMNLGYEQLKAEGKVDGVMPQPPAPAPVTTFVIEE